MRVISYFFLGFLFLYGLTEVQGQSMQGAPYASQQMEQAQEWLAAARFKKAKVLSQKFLTDNGLVIAEQAKYIYTLSAIALNQKDAMVLVSEFVTQYPSSLKSNQMYASVGYSYFNIGQYSKALPWFVKVNPFSIEGADLDKFYFSYGYARFADGDYKSATLLFEKVLNSKKFGPLATYYKAYVDYATGNTKAAKAVFSTPLPNTKITEKVVYYLADIYFKEGQFIEAIQAAQKYLPKANEIEASEINKIIGESYFNLQQYEKAIPYLKAYRGEKKSWAQQDYYQLGYSYYFIKEYESAIDQFNKIIQGKDALAQNAYYYLGASYLMTDQKQAALNAFKSASSLVFTPEITKDSYLNYAKLSYEVGNPYEAIASVLDHFILNYPLDVQTENLKELLINAYLLERNYTAALALLEQLPNMSTGPEKQTIALYAALEALEVKEFQKAIDFLDLIIQKDAKSALASTAYFWKAEIALRTYNYPAAFAAFDLLKPLKDKLSLRLQTLYPFQKGYAYFKTQKYAAAIAAFKEFSVLVDQNPDFTAEYEQSLVRMADAYYSLGDYKNAVSYYQTTILVSKDLKAYATFNSAMAYGLSGQLDLKIKMLEGFEKISKSPIYLPKAMLELGMAYSAAEMSVSAIHVFDKLISSFPSSSLVPEAQLKKGLLLYNQSELEAALEVFKKLTQNFSKSAEFSQAIAAAKRIYIEQGRVQDYLTWTKDLAVTPDSNESLERDSYEQITRRASLLDRMEQIKMYEGYLEDFPEGKQQLSIRFLLAQAYKDASLFEKALPEFQWVAEAQSENSESALVAVAQIRMEQKIGGDPIQSLEKLLVMAQDPQNRSYAMTNLMRLSYEKKDFNKLRNYAQQVLIIEGLDFQIKQDAQIMLARSAQEQGDAKEAAAAYLSLKNVATGELGAETWYWLAYYKQQTKDFEGSNVLVQELAKNYASYKIWAAKGLLLMADNFYALEDLFQAHFIWQNIIDNFSQFPDVVQQAKEKIASTKAETINTSQDDE